MPLHRFECKKCNHITERIVSNDIRRITCVVCDTWADKIMSASNFKINGYSESNGYSRKKK